MSPLEVQKLYIHEFNSLWDAITMLEAQECLRQIRILEYPYLRSETQRKRHKNLMTLAFPGMMEEKKPISIEELRKIHQPNFDRVLNERRKSEDNNRT